jgi:hypothetical protein
MRNSNDITLYGENQFLVKVKVKVFLCLTKHHAMKTYWGVEVYFHAFLTSALDGDKWSGSRPGRFTSRERAPGAHWIGGWVCTRAVLDAVVKRKFPNPAGLEPLIIQPIAQRCTTELPRLLYTSPLR